MELGAVKNEIEFLHVYGNAVRKLIYGPSSNFNHESASPFDFVGWSDEFGFFAVNCLE
jgi:hypothetical protein